MMARKATLAQEGGGSLSLMEESVALLRAAPAQAWATYLIGAAPYGLGLIWFWLENTRSAFARQHLAFTSGILALLFIWKQVSESSFLAQLRSLAGGKTKRARGLALVSLALRQAAVQPSSFLVIPLALAATIPFPYVLMFYRQFSLNAVDEGASLLGRSLETSKFAKGPVWTLTAVASLGAILLYVNLLVAAIFAAQVATSVFGVENLEVGVMALLSNTTVHFTIGVAVYLALDLLFDAAAALQSFRAVSVRSGDDILAALGRAAAVVLVLGALLTGPRMLAQQPPNPEAGTLDRAIAETLQQPEFAWRLEPAGSTTPPFVASLLEAVRAAVRRLDEWAEALARWLQPERPARERSTGRTSTPAVQYWLILLALLAAVGLSVMAVRGWRRKRAAVPSTAAAATAAPVDLRDESLLASTLPEDEWLRMAERYLTEGEPRLALRALHLACLRALAGRGLIAVQRSKTGIDYLDEVRRRTRQQPAIADKFAGNVRLFELGWYSSHPVTAGMVEAHRKATEEIRAHAR